MLANSRYVKPVGKYVVPKYRSHVAEHVQIEAHGDLALVRIDRPPANALDPELLDEGHRVAAQLAADLPAAVVLTGREGFFSAGVDLKVAPTLDAEGQRGMVEGINRLFAGWYSFPRPLVCAVNGHAIAGGFILALCGDYRVGATEGKYGLTEVKVGVPYPRVAMAIVRAELDPAAARLLALRSHLVDSQTALECGVFDELTDPKAVVSRALEVAQELSALPAATYERTKLELRADALAEARMALEQGDALAASWLE
jgi:enoyl-CoA hydratase/carnithine racemase